MPVRVELLEDRTAPAAAAGALNPSFGNGGIYSFPTETENGLQRSITPLFVVPLPDGRLDVLDYSYVIPNGAAAPSDQGPEARRLSADGRTDPTFGTNGITELPLSWQIYSPPTVQPDGGILIEGSSPDLSKQLVS
jgi:hypothetical protein